VAVRLVLAGLAYLITLGLAYGLLIPAVPADPTASESFVSPAVAPFVMTAVHTAVVGWLILRARRRGWGLVAVLIAVFFAVQTVMPQTESWHHRLHGEEDRDQDRHQAPPTPPRPQDQIGRASCRERV